MKHLYTTTLLAFMAYGINAQFSADFENISIAQDTFLNGADGTTEFVSEGCTFPVHFDSAGGYWASGFAISTMRDTADGTFMNLYSAYAADVNSDNVYAVANLGVGAVTAEASGSVDASFTWNSVDIANTTYARDVILNGNAFSKKFGGASGDDPDFFFIRFYVKNGSIVDSVDFYLADYRFENNEEDYVIDDWTTVDLGGLPRNGYDLTFKLFSSDTGAFGVNTPLFFALDNLKFGYTSSVDELSHTSFKAVSDFEGIRIHSSHAGRYQFFDLSGRLIAEEYLHAGDSEVHIAKGNRLVLVRQIAENKVQTAKIVH